ncbi:MAG: DUF2207 domain-containing protein [Actinomycetota bacterium]|nr:DUF2207 domain-containing protein [Actinomycetota bacterium]
MMRNCARIGGALLAVAIGVGFASAAQAAESINSYDVVATVQPNSVVDFKETINYDFSNTPNKHGIYRDLVVADEDSTGRTRLYDVRVLGVRVDGFLASYTLSDESNVLRIRIGDANTEVTGAHTYVITYSVAHALRVITKSDVADPQAPPGLAVGDVELFWDLIDNNFDVPITSAKASVAGPASPIASRCLLGSFGSTKTCPLAVNGQTVDLGPSPVANGEFLTTAIDYPAAAFTVKPVEVFEPEQPIGLAMIIGAVLFLALLIVPIVLAIRWRRGDKGVAVNATPVQFEPPDRLSAVEMAAAWKGDNASMRPRAMVAALTDLAARGQVVIADADHLTVALVPQAAVKVQAWEAMLLDQIFAAGSPASLGSYNAELADVWGTEFSGLVGAAEAAGRRNAEGGTPDRRWNWMFLVAAVGVALFIASIAFKSPPVTVVAVCIVIGSILGGAIARAITPRRETEASARFLMLTLGFRRLLETDASAARREFAQRLGLPAGAILATMLPYAVVFSLEQSWVGAFPDLTPEELQATGFNVLTIAAMSSLVSSASHSASSSLTAPSSGSGSGGGAGGGGGGGGGGSW